MLQPRFGDYVMSILILWFVNSLRRAEMEDERERKLQARL